VFPLTFAVVREVSPPGRVATGIAALTAGFGVGTVAGFVAGGYLAEGLSWRWVFGIGAAVTTLAIALVAWRVPRSADRSAGGFDVLGALLLSVASVGWIVWLTLGAEVGFGAWPSWLSLVVALAGSAAWVQWERRHPDPLIDLSIFRLPAVRWSNLASIGLGWGLFAGYFLLPQLMRTDPGQTGFGFGAGPARIGLLLLPAAVGQVAAGPLAGPLTSRSSPRTVLAGGLLSIAGALAWLSVVTTSTWQLLCAAGLLGLGSGLGVQAAGDVTTEQVDGSIAAVSSSVNSTIRRFAGGIGGQVGALLLAIVATGGHPTHGAYVVAFLLSAGVALLGAAACRLIPSD
jgi:predicted MFS family arabinose efflux permease